jgi:isochorismate hydrolase
MQPNLLKVGLSQLLIVDVQTRLIGVMPEADMAACLKQSGILAQAAALLAVPIILTEQYPKGLGHTDPALMAHLTGVLPVEKIAFSCMAEAKVKRQFSRDRSQIVLAGMEAHICILQTAMDLMSMGKQVYVAEDAIISRQPANKANAIARMREAGCIISNTESIVFEWLGRAEGDAFKAISKLIR